MDLGGVLRAARERAALSQIDIAVELGVTQPTVARFESGVRTPGPAHLEAWWRACGLTARVVLEPASAPPPDGALLLLPPAQRVAEFVVSAIQTQVALLRRRGGWEAPVVLIGPGAARMQGCPVAESTVGPLVAERDVERFLRSYAWVHPYLLDARTRRPTATFLDAEVLLQRRRVVCRTTFGDVIVEVRAEPPPVISLAVPGGVLHHARLDALSEDDVDAETRRAGVRRWFGRELPGPRLPGAPLPGAAGPVAAGPAEAGAAEAGAAGPRVGDLRRARGAA